tara:strand:+ start:222 stop:356 length:135 start_codon:yes stop_codon:yes gene_type:complete
MLMTQKELEQIILLIKNEVGRELDVREQQTADNKKAAKKVKETA